MRSQSRRTALNTIGYSAWRRLLNAGQLRAGAAVAATLVALASGCGDSAAATPPTASDAPYPGSREAWKGANLGYQHVETIRTLGKRFNASLDSGGSIRLH
jgi:hypothetical protein